MTIEKAKQALKDLKSFANNNPQEFDNIIKELGKNGYVTNIDNYYFEVEVAEYWMPYCCEYIYEYMQEKGYENCTIMAYAKYYGESTPPKGKYDACSHYMYVLYDENIWGADEDISQRRAEEFLDSEFDRSLKNNANQGISIKQS